VNGDVTVLHRDSESEKIRNLLETRFGASNMDALNRSITFSSNPSLWAPSVVYAVEKPEYRMFAFRDDPGQLSIIVEPQIPNCKAVCQDVCRTIKKSLKPLHAKKPTVIIKDGDTDLLTATSGVLRSLTSDQVLSVLLTAIATLALVAVFWKFTTLALAPVLLGAVPVFVAGAIALSSALISSARGGLVWKT
jgi:hypothetical protein